MKRAAIITIFTVVISVGVLSAGKAQPLVMLHYHAWAEYNHAAGVAGFTELINETAAALGYIVDHSDDPNLLQPEILKGYDIIIFDNNCYVASPIVSGNAANKQAFRDYMEQGGKWLGLHAGPAYAEQGWDWFRYDFFGCEFIRHGYGTFDLKIDDEVYDDPELTAMIEFLGLPQYATVEEETYEWGKCGTEGDGSLRGDPRVKIIQTMEPGMYNDHAYSWAKDLDGGGRMVFTSINHDATVWDMDDRYHRQMLVGYLKYLAGDFAAVEGCMDPGYEEYDSMATVSRPDMCLTVSTAAPGTREALSSDATGITIPVSAAFTIVISDINGRVVHAERGRGSSMYRLPELRTPGVYIIDLSVNNRHSVRKFILE
jgi:hypothetical protein